MAGSCEHGNETSASVNGGEILNSRSGNSFTKMTLIHGVQIIVSCIIFRHGQFFQHTKYRGVMSFRPSETVNGFRIKVCVGSLRKNLSVRF